MRDKRFCKARRGPLLAFLGVLFLCLGGTAFLLASVRAPFHDVRVIAPAAPGKESLTLAPGGTLRQEFTAHGTVQSLWGAVYLDVPEARKTRQISVRVSSADGADVLFSGTLILSQRDEAGWAALEFPYEIFLQSGKKYALEVENAAEVPLRLGYNPAGQSGPLTLDGQREPGLLNFKILRIDTYEPTPLFYLTLLLVNAVVLVGAALVLFRRVRTEVLYLFLAVGFGISTLCDLTPLYGFDMPFHFDSAYAVSNEMLGLGGPTLGQSRKEPGRTVLFYERRACDDTTFYCYESSDYVSTNYTDTFQGLRHFRAAPEDRVLETVETEIGGVGEQLYLYLPQALGFTLARLLGLGLYPMLQLARVLNYALFVLLAWRAIRAVPFGKNIFLILALVPTTLIQTVSITRDALLLGMGFLLTAKVLEASYREAGPTRRDWAEVLALSILLAPCKMVYLPMSFLWLLPLWRRYRAEGRLTRGKTVMTALALSVPIVVYFLVSSLGSISILAQTEKADVYGTTAYSMDYILTHPGHSLYVAANTLRDSLGSYLMNAVQLYDIRLGSSDGLSLLIFFLLILASARPEAAKKRVRTGDRVFALVVFAGVLGLLTLASLQWTPFGYKTVLGLQGRYLTPALPLLCFALGGGDYLRSGERAETLVRLGCCIYPAVMLFNMYLWTIRATA